jgi:hypothetical protein
MPAQLSGTLPQHCVVSYLILPMALWACSEPLQLGEQSDRRLTPAEAHALVLLGSAQHLPTSAAKVRLYRNEFQDRFEFLAFDAPRQDAIAFATRLAGIPPAAGAGGYSFGLSLRPCWWPDIYPLSGFGTNVRHGSSGIAHDIVIEPMGDQARVWLLSTQT